MRQARVQRHPAKRRAVWLSLLLSSVLHLAVLYLARDLGVEGRAVEAFRARLIEIPRFQPRRLSGSPQAALPETRMEYLETQRLAREPAGLPLATLQQQHLAPLPVPAQPLALREFDVAAKEEEPAAERVVMLRPGDLGLADSLRLPSMDLLRIVDMARANRYHAMVMPDPHSRRDLLGYINLARIRVYGAGTEPRRQRGAAGPEGGAWLQALARFARDHSKLLVRVNSQIHDYFVSPELLKAPVIFLFQDCGLEAYRDEVAAYFSAEEQAVLKQYLEGGGFLFIEGRNRYLREMATYLREILAQAELGPLPAGHPLYSAFFEFEDGFPGEQGKTRYPSWLDASHWQYPAQADQVPVSAAAAPPVDPALVAAQREPTRPLGLWAVRWRGRVVALLSDVGLHQAWQQSQSEEDPGFSAQGALMAGLNILAYALTQEGTLTLHQERPAWMASSLRPEAPAYDPLAAAAAQPGPDAELLDMLDASLAVVQVPASATVAARPLVLRVNGAYRLELPRLRGRGVLLHNMPPGRHWLELRHGGSTRQVEIDLPGGRVTTVTFGLNRFAFVEQLRLEVEDRRVPLAQWQAAFSDLELEEVFLGEDRALVERSAAALRP